MKFLRFPEHQDQVIEALVEDLSAKEVAHFVAQLLNLYNSKCATRLTIGLLSDIERKQKWNNLDE